MSVADNLVSIIVPVYNAEKYLQDALASALNQTHTSIELICINDGSTDNSLALLQEAANSDARVHIIDKPNAGYGAAMNQGIAAARGTWIAILEPDDWIDTRMLEHMLAYAATFANVPDIVKCPYWRVREDDTPAMPLWKKQVCTYKGLIPKTSELFTLCEAPELFARHPSIWSALYLRNFLQREQISFPEHPGSGWADNRFLADTLARASRIAYLDQEFYHYRAGTQQAEQAFLKASPTIPFERWHEMADALEAAGVTSDAIWQAHIRRGCTYLMQVQEAVGLDQPEVQAAVERLFERMPESLVLAEPALSPSFKKRYLLVMGKDQRRVSRIPYMLYQARFLLKHVQAQLFH